MTTQSQREVQPTILSYIKDLANLCSLAGLACALLAIYCIFLGNYYAAMIGMIWAVAFDWADGMVARKMKGRTELDGLFGGQLDSLIDLVSYGVAPAILLIYIGEFNPLFFPGAFIMISASALRLSYFNTYGLSDGSRYTGLAVDNNNIIIVFIFLFQSILSEEIFSRILYVSCMVIAALNVSQIKTPKLNGSSVSVYTLAFYTIAMSVFYGWKLL